MSLPFKEIEKPIQEESGIVQVVETTTTPEITEISPHVEVEEKEDLTLTQDQKVVDKNTQEELLSDANPRKEIKLPLTEQQMEKALHLKIIYSFRWLAEWMKRVLKIVSGKFTYRMTSGG
jgi:hypothetical protein